VKSFSLRINEYHPSGQVFSVAFFLVVFYLHIRNEIVLFLGYENEFEIVDPLLFDTLGLPYDYGSIMHYSQLEFSSNKQPTIISKDPQWQTKMGKNSMPSSMVKETEAKTYHSFVLTTKIISLNNSRISFA